MPCPLRCVSNFHEGIIRTYVHMCRGKELGGKEGGPQRELGHLHVCVHCKYVRTVHVYV